jgi:glycosyltransferase involved in cell wall biosynthesis
VISFVVPAHNEARLIGSCLASIRTCAEALELESEIIVANDASTDATGDIARAAGARVVDVALRHIAAVRNAGARAATGDRLIFVDADSRVDIALVKAAVAALDAGAIGGGAGVRFEEPVPWWATVMLHAVMGTLRIAKWAAGSFVFCTRQAFEAVGGFDERFYASEEIATSRKLKKVGRFVILRETIVTSARKVRGRSFFQLWWMLTRLAFTRGGLRKRDALDFWYRDPR